MNWFWGVLGVLVFLTALFMLREGFTSGGKAAACKVVGHELTEDGQVELVNLSCKEGLPHTTDSNTIRMPVALWTGPTRDDIMVHERVHLSQKREPAEWAEFYRRYWDYDMLSTPPAGLPADYVAALRPNPDTDAAPWALWRKRYLFFPTYASSDRTLRNPKIVVWDVQQKRRVEAPPEWTAFFCVDGACPQQFEHPHELSAEMLTKGYKSPASEQLRGWRSGSLP
jgi:hypothetical protein